MVATSPLSTRPRYQWEWDSRQPPPDPGNAPFNCGPAGMAKILEFYLDKYVNIHLVRRSSGVGDYLPTGVVQQALMGTRNGVPCDVRALTVEQLTSYISSGRRPVAIGLDMAKVPLSIKDHDFDGAHLVVAMANVTRNGVRGKLIMDPNFSPVTGRLDPDRGQKFYSDSLIASAMNSPKTQRWSVVPRAAKVIPAAPSTRVRIHSMMQVRGAPYIRSSPGGNVVGTARAGTRYVGRWLEKAGPTYYDPWGKKNRRDWVGIERSGTIQWIAKAFIYTLYAL